MAHNSGLPNLPFIQPKRRLDIPRNVPQQQAFLLSMTRVNSERALRKLLYVYFPLSFYVETNTILFSEKTTCLHPLLSLQDDNETNLGDKRAPPSLVGSRGPWENSAEHCAGKPELWSCAQGVILG